MNAKEKGLIRDLAKRVKELSLQPIMEERRNKWYAHNDLKSSEPMLLVFPEGGWREIITPEMLVCEDEEARYMEWMLRARLYRAEEINDDSVVEGIWEVSKMISNTGWGIRKDGATAAIGNKFAVDDSIGYCPMVWKKDFKFVEKAMPFSPCIEDEDDLKKLHAPTILYDEKGTMERLQIHGDVIGDILDVRLVGQKYIMFNLMEMYTDHRGLENVMYDLYEEPEMTHRAMEIFEAGFRSMVQQYKDMNLLEMNNDHSYCGSGGVGYTHDLPRNANGAKDTVNMWAFAESQEFTSVSPEQHKEFVMDYEARLLEPFGLSAYGCCEPIEKKLDTVLRMPNMRRISVSPWANIESCAQQIGMKAVYSWKPNPSYFINNFNEEWLSDYVRKMLMATKNNAAEIILKDTHTCQKDPERYGKWTRLVRKAIEETR